jgi:predicted RNase H-like HicB family nuclease
VNLTIQGMKEMVFKVVLEPSEEGGYTAVAPSLPGCVSEGDTMEEALKNIREAIELYLEPVGEEELSREGVLIKELVI